MQGQYPLPPNPYERIAATGVVDPPVVCELCDRRIPEDEAVFLWRDVPCCESCRRDLYFEEDEDGEI